MVSRLKGMVCFLIKIDIGNVMVPYLHWGMMMRTRGTAVDLYNPMLQVRTSLAGPVSPDNEKEWSLGSAGWPLRNLYHHTEHEVLVNAEAATTGDEICYVSETYYQLRLGVVDVFSRSL